MTTHDDRPRIVLLSLNHQSYFDEMYGSLINALMRRGHVQRAKDPESAMELLEYGPPPMVVLMTDDGLTHKEHRRIWETVLEYVRHGGTAVAMGHFSSYVQPFNVRPFFDRADLPWDQGAYQRTTVALNWAVVPPEVAAGLLPEYSLKAMYLSHVAREDSLYLTKENSLVESLSGSRGSAHAPGQAPVTLARVGEGRLGYVGDVNAEEGSDYIVLAMCGLDD